MSDHELEINVGELDAGGRAYRFSVPQAFVRGLLEGHEAKAPDKDGVLDIRASKSGTDIVVTGTLDAELKLPCARCTELYTFSVHTQIRVLYAPATKAKGSDKQEYEFTDEEADILPYDGEKVVLDDLVRDELLLEIPMIPLCSEDCAGMSTPPDGSTETSRTEKAIDPRLAPLLGFRGAAKNSKA